MISVAPHQKVLIVLGTRPEAIKLASVIRVLQDYPDHFKVTVCVTGQHREMLDQVIQVFSIAPQIDLDLMELNQSLSGLAARVLQALDPVLVEQEPDWVLVQGDTTTAMAAALAAKHRKIKVGHIEAGLRTGNLDSPFPEEMNRILIDHVSDFCFAPTSQSRRNLLREGIPENRILITGNTGIDSLLMAIDMEWSPTDSHVLSQLPTDRRWILVTAHRRESFGVPLENICLALRDIAVSRSDVEIVFPVHRNPHVVSTVHARLAGVPNVHLLPPVDYLTLVYLMKNCYLILSDSGGIQEEAPTLHKPVLILRDHTERPEAVALGANKLIGTQRAHIVAETLQLLDNKDMYESVTAVDNPFGDGQASLRIAASLHPALHLDTSNCDIA